MRIGIPARGLKVKSGGAKEYIRNLLQHLPRVDPGNEYYFYYADRSHLSGTERENVRERVIPHCSDLIWDHLQLPMQMHRDRIELALFPKGTLPILSRVKSISTVLDLAYFYPGLDAYPLGDTLYMKFMIPRSVRQAAAVIAISDNTRLDVHRFVSGLSDEKISVVHLAAAQRSPLSESNSVRKKYGLSDKPYIFMSSSLSPRKNIERAVLAFASISSRIPHEMVLTGGKRWGTTRLPGILSKYNLEERVKQLGHVHDDDLPALYSGADLYIMPSLYEGFSMTILEAMQQGCPVVVSNVSSHPEVAGDAAVYCDPYSVDSIARAMFQVLDDSLLRQQLRERGLQRAADFTWERCAQETLAVIRRVAAAT